MSFGSGPQLVGNSRKAQAVKDFQNARMQASLQEISSIITGRSVALLSFDDVSDKLKMQGQVNRGRQSIPVANIVGSVGRYNDFTRTFLPKADHDKSRWAGVRSAAHHVGDLPPIEVYQVGDAYFVIDGNHRVSIARQDGVEFVDALVTEVQTRVELTAEDDPYSLIIKAEYVQFLEETELDRSRPDADLMLSVPGHYGKLIHHIEAHRFCMQNELEREIEFPTAAAAWYEETYIPIVAAIRERGILRHFPGRTETDFYLWISENQTALSEGLGWDIRPEVAVTQLAARFEPPKESRVAKLRRRVLQIVPGVKSGVPDQTWSESKILARYSDRLFADILVPLTRANQLDGLPALLPFIQAEEAQLFGLHLPGFDEHDNWADAFHEHCQRADIKGALAQETGEPVAGICDRAILADLIAVSHHFPGHPNEPMPSPMLIALLQQSRRPILVHGHRPVKLGHTMLVFEDTDAGNEALFIAAYLTERHGCGLSVLTGGGGTPDAARNYLTMHEIDARYLHQPKFDADTVLHMAEENGVDLIVLPGISRRRLGRDGGTALTEAVLAGGHDRAHGRALLVGP